MLSCPPITRENYSHALTGEKPGKHADLKYPFPRFLASVLLSAISAIRSLEIVEGDVIGSKSGRLDGVGGGGGVAPLSVVRPREGWEFAAAPVEPPCRLGRFLLVPRPIYVVPFSACYCCYFWRGVLVEMEMEMETDLPALLLFRNDLFESHSTSMALNA